MISVAIKRTDGSVLKKIHLPEHPREVSLARYVSFITESSKAHLPGANVPLCMAKAVAEFTGEPIDQILTAEFGTEWTQGDSAGIRGLYGWILKAVGRWEGVDRTAQDFQFTHNGETFEIPFSTVLALGGHQHAEISVNEYIEASEVNRLVRERATKAANVRQAVSAITSGSGTQDHVFHLKEAEPDANVDEMAMEELHRFCAQHGDENGDLLFTRYIRLMAILCRRPGEKLPLSENEKERFIQERCVFFQDIDASTALDVDFFLSTSLSAFGRTIPVVGILIHQAFALMVETRVKSVKHTPGRKNTRKRSLGA